MAGIKNQEVAATLRRWLKMNRVSNAEAARILHVSAPVLWRQLEAKDSIPFSRIEEFISRWAPSDEEIARLKDLMNEPAASGALHDEKDYRFHAGKLDVIADMLSNVIAPAVPENMKPVVAAIVDSLNHIVAEMNNPSAFDSTGKE